MYYDQFLIMFVSGVVSFSCMIILEATGFMDKIVNYLNEVFKHLR